MPIESPRSVYILHDSIRNSSIAQGAIEKVPALALVSTAHPGQARLRRPVLPIRQRQPDNHSAPSKSATRTFTCWLSKFGGN